MNLIAAVLWRRLDVPALEHSRLFETPVGFLLEGRVLTLVDDSPAEAHYAVQCGADWITREAQVHVVQGASTKSIRIRRDESGRWWADDAWLPELDGVVDIDLQLSPSTNTLPIRRMALGVGESRATDAAWVRFPALTCERLSQRYARVAELRYRYESRAGAFVADLDIDEHGLVVRYDDIWDRVTG